MSLIRFLRAKSSPFLTFSSPKKTWPTANDTPPVIHLHDALAVSKAMFSHGPCTHCKMPCPEIHRIWQSHAGNHSSISSCIIHKAMKHFAKGKYSPEHATNSNKSKSSSLAGNFYAAAPYWTPPKSRCRSSPQESCLGLRAWIYLNSLGNFSLQRPNSALAHSEAQNIPQFFEGCC